MLLLLLTALDNVCALPLYYWKRGGNKYNFGDEISIHLVSRITGTKISYINALANQPKLCAIGSIIHHIAGEHNVIWGSGVNGKDKNKSLKFTKTDIRAVRGPLTRAYLLEQNISCPEIYGDPALLFPWFFPEFAKQPKYEYIIIPHYSEEHLFPKSLYKNLVYPSEPWQDVISKIVSSKFVISSSLHGIIIAEAYGIPARLLKINDNEPLFKYEDYYQGTGRVTFTPAHSVEEALAMQGEPPLQCDLQKLYGAFPFDYWQ